MSLVTEEIRAKAEIYHRDQICQEKRYELISGIGFPNGIFPFFEDDVIEAGIVRETGFLWVKLKEPKTHKYEKIGRLSSFATEITAFFDRYKAKKVTEIKAKEMMVRVTISEVYLDAETGKMTFKTPSGLYRTYPASAFEIDDETSKELDNNEVNQEAMKAKN